MNLLGSLVGIAAEHSPFNMGMNLISNQIERRADLNAEKELMDKQAEIFKDSGSRVQPSSRRSAQPANHPYKAPKASFNYNFNHQGGKVDNKPMAHQFMPSTAERNSKIIRDSNNYFPHPASTKPPSQSSEGSNDSDVSYSIGRWLGEENPPSEHPSYPDDDSSSFASSSVPSSRGPRMGMSRGIHSAPPPAPRQPNSAPAFTGQQAPPGE